MKRRKRNRKKQAQGFVFPVPLALFLVMVTVISMTYLWMQGRAEAAGIRIQQLETQRHRVGQVRQDEERKWAQLKTLPNVRQAVARHNLGMDWVPDHRVVHLYRPYMDGDSFLYGDFASATGTVMND